MPEQGCQAGDQAGQVHPHQGPPQTVWMAISEAASDLLQLGSPSQSLQESETSQP